MSSARREAVRRFADTAQAHLDRGDMSLAVTQVICGLRASASEADHAHELAHTGRGSRSALVRAIGAYAEAREQCAKASTGSTRTALNVAHVDMLRALDAFELQLRGRS